MNKDDDKICIHKQDFDRVMDKIDSMLSNMEYQEYDRAYMHMWDVFYIFKQYFEESENPDQPRLL